MRYGFGLSVVLLALAVSFATTSGALAYCNGTSGLVARKSSCGCEGCATQKPCLNYKTMTFTRTVYDRVPEKCHKTVYDTVWDQQTVKDVKRVPKTQYESQEFTYQRPIFETRTREVPYTTLRPVCQMCTREVRYTTYVPAYEKRIRSIPCTNYRTVQETGYRTVSRRCPRRETYTKTIQVRSGHWETRMVECRPTPPVTQKGVSQKDAAQKGVVQKSPCVKCTRVWIPCVEEREITCCRTVYDIHTEQVPYCYTRLIPEVYTREVPYTVCRMMPVQQSRTINYPVTRMISEQHSRTVSYVVRRMVPETGIRCVPITTYEDVPVTQTACVPRQVPRDVFYTTTRCVPRTITCEVKVPICRPQPCKGKKGCTDCDTSIEGDLPTPAIPDDSSESVTRLPSAEAFEIVPVSTVASSPHLEDGSRSFQVGLHHYWTDDFAAAAEELEAATNAAPQNAKYAYFHALALRGAGRDVESVRMLATAIELEKLAPVASWGRVMERVQGAPRLWLETARQQSRH